MLFLKTRFTWPILFWSLLLFAGAAKAEAVQGPELLTLGGADSTAILHARAAMWRSLLLPGWGQAYNQEWLKSLAIAGGELGLLLGAHRQHKNWQDWSDRRQLAYLSDDVDLQEFTAWRADFYLNDRNKLLWYWLWLRLASVMDAYVGGHMSNYQDNLALEFQPLTLGNEPRAGLQLEIRIPLRLKY